MWQFGSEDSDISEDSESVDKRRHTHKNWLSMQYTMEAHKDIMSPSQYREHLRNLNPGQRQIVMSCDQSYQEGCYILFQLTGKLNQMTLLFF